MSMIALNFLCYNSYKTVRDSAYIQGGSKSKLLILAVSEINASQTRVSFAKFIPTLIENMFGVYSIVPNYSFSILKFFIKILSSLLILPIITIWNMLLN